MVPAPLHRYIISFKFAFRRSWLKIRVYCSLYKGIKRGGKKEAPLCVQHPLPHLTRPFCCCRNIFTCPQNDFLVFYITFSLVSGWRADLIFPHYCRLGRCFFRPCPAACPVTTPCQRGDWGKGSCHDVGTHTHVTCRWHAYTDNRLAKKVLRGPRPLEPRTAKPLSLAHSHSRSLSRSLSLCRCRPVMLFDGFWLSGIVVVACFIFILTLFYTHFRPQLRWQ